MRIAILAAGLARGTPQNALVEEYLTRARGIGRHLGVVSLTVEEISLSKLREARETRDATPMPSSRQRKVLRWQAGHESC